MYNEEEPPWTLEDGGDGDTPVLAGPGAGLEEDPGVGLEKILELDWCCCWGVCT